MRRAVFLDRDGTLNVDSPQYVKTWDEFVWLPGVAGALRELQTAGFSLVVVTNQGSIAKGLTSREEVERVHSLMREELAEAGVHIDAVYYCPHRNEDLCECRKPQPGMLLRAANELGLSLEDCWMIGDREADITAGTAAGCRTLKVTRGYNLSDAASTIVAGLEPHVVSTFDAPHPAGD